MIPRILSLLAAVILTLTLVGCGTPPETTAKAGPATALARVYKTSPQVALSVTDARPGGMPSAVLLRRPNYTRPVVRFNTTVAQQVENALKEALAKTGAKIVDDSNMRLEATIKEYYTYWPDGFGVEVRGIATLDLQLIDVTTGKSVAQTTVSRMETETAFGGGLADADARRVTDAVLPAIVREAAMAPEITSAIEQFKTPQQREQIRIDQIRQKVEGFIASNDIQGLKRFTETNPEGVNYIPDPNLRLMLTGPKGQKVGDIIRLVDDGRSDALIIPVIKRAKSPYREYTIDEMMILSEMGLSDQIIGAMVQVTTKFYARDAAAKAEAERLEKQMEIARANQKQQTTIVHQNSGAPAQRGPTASEQLQQELTRQASKQLLKSLF